MEKIYVVMIGLESGESELVSAYFNKGNAKVKMNEVLDEWVNEEFNSYGNTQSKKELKEIAEINDDNIEYAGDYIYIEELDLHK